MKNFPKNPTKIIHLSVKEEDYMKSANATLNNLEEKIKRLEEEKHQLLHTIYIAKLYYKNKKENLHKPSKLELEDLFGDGQ
jgi:hypothetical protein